MNYVGNKKKLLPQILPLIPSNIRTFVDLFAGGCSVGINVKSEKLIFNDNINYLIDLYREFLDRDLCFIINYIDARVEELGLTKENQEGYLKLRSEYNEFRNPLDLFVLVSFSFNHQIRFNSSHGFNNPFGKNRSSYNERMKKNLISFVEEVKLRQAVFVAKEFHDFDFDSLGSEDFVYCDPPYLITTGVYNDGKRGFNGWSEQEELRLLDLLDDLNSKNIRFALSNVIEHKGKENKILKEWLSSKNYFKYILNSSYSNSSYNTNRSPSVELLVTNYRSVL